MSSRTIDPATVRFLHRLGATLALKSYLGVPPGCQGYVNGCECKDCRKRSDAVQNVLNANPWMSEEQAVTEALRPPERARQPWETAEAA